LIITIFLFINFVLIALLDLIKYFKKNILYTKGKKLTGNTIGLTYDEINNEYKRNNNQEHNQCGTLSAEIEDIHNKIKIIQDNFDKKYFQFSNIIELLFSFIVPTILAIVSSVCLYTFLAQPSNSKVNTLEKADDRTHNIVYEQNKKYNKTSERNKLPKHF